MGSDQPRQRTRVFSSNELPDGTMRQARIGHRVLLLVRRGDTVYALRDVCPHQGAPLSAGLLTCARKPASVGHYEPEHSGVIVRCPWHNWEIDVSCGAARHDRERFRIATYPAGIEDDQGFVEV